MSSPVVVITAVDVPPVGGGVSRYYAGLSESFSEELRLVPVWTSPPDSGVGKGGLRVRLGEALLAAKLADRARLDREYVLHGHPHLALPDAIRGKSYGLFLHGGEWRSLGPAARALDFIVARAAVVIANSHATVQLTVPERYRSKAIVIHPGLTAEFIRISGQLARNRSGDPASRTEPPLKLLTVARLVERKGVADVIQAVRRLEFPVILNIVGDGPERVALEGVAGGDARINFVGAIADAELFRLYASSAAFILCPYETMRAEGHEGFGIVYLEAAAFGLAIIASRTGGVEEALPPRGAFLVRPRDIDEISCAIRELHSSSAVRCEMAELNRGWAVANSWDMRHAAFARAVAALKLPNLPESDGC